MMDLPAAPFDACDQASGQVNSQALMRYETNDHSVPVAYGHRDVWVRIPTHPVGRSDNIRSAIPEYPVT